jgi:hypothetical protein
LEKENSRDKKKAIIKEVALSRQTKRFLITLLWFQRNSLAHEGLSYSTNLRFYLRLLEEVLEQVQHVFLSVGQKGRVITDHASERRLNGYSKLKSYVVSR